MTSTTETETKVEPQVPNKDETLPAANDNTDAVKDGDKPAETNSAPASPTKKTGTLKNAITAHKKDFEKDIVYLYQFVRTPTIPSLSACCLKVETWLRINGIQYENIDHKLRYKSKKGNLPFVELNGKEIDDADIIIRELATCFEKNLDEGLDADQRTVAHAFESMLDNHTGWIVRWWRYNNPQDFLDTAQLDIKRSFNSRFPNSILNFVFKLGFRKHLKDAVASYPLGRFDSEEVFLAAKSDLKALSQFLGPQNYFFGKTPRLLDCYAFAHLAQFVYVPFGGLKEWIEEETPNLSAFVERIKTNYWSDWDAIVNTLDMNTHLPKKEVPESTEENVAAAAAAAAAKPSAEDAKKAAEEKKAEKKRLAEEKKKEREEKKKKEKEEKERKKKEKEEADKAAKEKAAAEEAAKQAEKAAAAAAEQAKAENAAPVEAAAAAAETKEAEKPADNAPNGADAAKTEVTASE